MIIMQTQGTRQILDKKDGFLNVRKSELFFKKVKSFVVLPNPRGDGLKLQFICENLDGRTKVYFLNYFIYLDSDIVEYRRRCREDLKPFLQERHLKFYNLITCKTLINNRDSYFKEVDKIKVFQRAKSIYGPGSSRIPLIMKVIFKDGTEYVTNYDLTKI